MNKAGIIVASMAILAAGLLYVRQGAKNDPAEQVHASGKGSETFNTWQPFRPNSGLFKVLLPHPPQYAKDLVAIPGSDQKRRYDMYASEKIDGSLFLISVITYPTEAESSESADLLKQTVDELMRSKPDNQLTSIKELVFKGHPALDFIITNREFKVQGIVFMLGKSIYVLSYVAQQDDYSAKEFQHFVDSFELLDKEGSR